MSLRLAGLCTCLAAVFSTSIGSADIIFSDNYDRPDNRNIDGSIQGIIDNTGSNLSIDSTYLHGFIDPNNDTGIDGNAANGGGAQIIGNQLELADGAGTSNTFINHNFTNQTFLNAGGFNLTLDIAGTQGQSSGAFGGGFAIGMTMAEALDTGDALQGEGSSTNNYKMQDGLLDGANTVDEIAISDFWTVLRADGTLVWGGFGNSVTGTDESGLFGSLAVGSDAGTLSADFFFSDFTAGSNVDYDLYFDGVLAGSGSFQWSDTDSNYIGLEGRDSNGVLFDNLTIAAVPEPASGSCLAMLAMFGLAWRRRSRG